jgi:hypothetical protein
MGMAYITKDMVTEWGKEAAQQLIEHQVPLNESLVKIAQDHELNTDQVARVVEAANISTHLTVNSGENKYPEFEVASLQKVAGTLAHETPAETNISDYELAPRDFKYASMTKEACVNITDGVEEEMAPRVQQRVKEAFTGFATHYDNRLDDLEHDIYKKAEELKHFVKQAALDPDQREASLTLFKTAATEATAEMWKSATSAILREIDLDIKDVCGKAIYKEASADSFLRTDAVLNPDSEAISKLASYLNSVKTYAIASEARDENLTKLALDMIGKLGVTEKQASKLTFLKSLTKPFSWAAEGATKKSKALRGAAVLSIPAIGAGAVATTAHKAGRDKATAKLAPMRASKLPQRYKRY